MRRSGLFVPAGAYRVAVAHDHAADAGIGCGGVQALFGEAQRLGHVLLIGGAEHADSAFGTKRPYGPGRRALRPGRLTCKMASRKSSTRWKSSYTEAKRM